MCSILGQINFSDSLCDSKKFINASDTLRHRGPDSKNYLSDEVNFQFAFNRLAIMDLNHTGSQPMYSQCKRYVCIFNGEIYNYQKIYEEIKDLFKWEGSSDTEVLINAWSLWGEKTLDKIDGMFAFAVWDTVNKDVTLVRDRIGEKPLYYYTESDSLIFSSRPNPILKIYPKLKKDIDLENLNYYFEAGYFSRKKSYIKNIFKLEPGNFIKFNKDGLLIKKYWSINDYNPKKVNPYTLNYHTDKCEDLLKESISERIISDKPLGFLLSGGIDSSLVISMASKIMDKKIINAFSLGFYNKEYDESIDAILVAKKLDINLDIKKITHKDVLKLLPDFYQKFDEPFADPASLPLIELSKFAKNKVDVVLTGDGGDELFGGYHYYSIINLLNKIRPLSKLIKNKYLSFLLKKFGSHRLNLLLDVLNYNNPIRQYAFMRSSKKNFLNIFNLKDNNNVDIYQNYLNSWNEMSANNNLLDRVMKLDILHTLNDNYLQKTDQSTMMCSLESRSPFLSRNLVEYCLSMPSKFKVNLFNKKIILKKIAKKYLPEEIINKKKKGFEIPIKEWLRYELKEWSFNLINNKENYVNLSINKETILDIYKMHLSKKKDCHPYLWNILMFLSFNEYKNKNGNKNFNSSNTN